MVTVLTSVQELERGYEHDSVQAGLEQQRQEKGHDQSNGTGVQACSHVVQEDNVREAVEDTPTGGGAGQGQTIEHDGFNKHNNTFYSLHNLLYDSWNYDSVIPVVNDNRFLLTTLLCEKKKLAHQSLCNQSQTH